MYLEQKPLQIYNSLNSDLFTADERNIVKCLNLAQLSDPKAHLHS